MRHVQKQFVPAQDTAEFRFNFQMISAGARHACSVTIRAADEVQAATLFRENWSSIEELARKNLAINAREQIRLKPAYSSRDAVLASPPRGNAPQAAAVELAS